MPYSDNLKVLPKSKKVFFTSKHIDNSNFKLTVIVNPNEMEYGSAVKNNFIGFKALIHDPNEFANVAGKGIAIGKFMQ